MQSSSSGVTTYHKAFDHKPSSLALCAFPTGQSAYAACATLPERSKAPTLCRCAGRSTIMCNATIRPGPDTQPPTGSSPGCPAANRNGAVAAVHACPALMCSKGRQYAGKPASNPSWFRSSTLHQTALNMEDNKMRETKPCLRNTCCLCTVHLHRKPSTSTWWRCCEVAHYITLHYTAHH